MKGYAEHFKDRAWRRSFGVAILFLLASFVVNFQAGIYVTERASNSVTDIILSNTTPIDLDGLFVYATWAFVFLIIYLCTTRPKQAPYIIKSIALFVIIRSAFISMTHIGPFPNQDVIDPESYLRYFVFGADLFFSGHTGLPFLLSLIFWNERRWRDTLLVISGFFAVIVLLAHMHYTIDVFSAWFISYGIYKITEKAFKEDRFRFLEA